MFFKQFSFLQRTHGYGSRYFSKKAPSTPKVANIPNLGDSERTHLPRNTNQVRGLIEFSQKFIFDNPISNINPEVLERVELFHTDSVFCGLSALSLKCNAPTTLRDEALDYKYDKGTYVFGSNEKVRSEKAIVANCSAVREWDSNGTVFGYNPRLGKSFQAGEFGHNDYYPVVIAACQLQGFGGKQALLGMLLLDEIRGRLAEVFSLKTYKIDHVVHGAIASAIVYGVLVDASVEQIESAVGMLVAHYIPFRAIRAGHQLSDSKGASAAITTEAAILSVHRSMNLFKGPSDIFRNPQAIFRLFKPTNSDEESPFDLVLTHSGSDFSVMGMHFKLGLYEHQSASAIEALLDALQQDPDIINNVDDIDKITIKIYEPAFSIIGDPDKRNPTTRQSADHSMVYIISSILRKANNLGPREIRLCNNKDDLWKLLMLLPYDYQDEALFNPITRKYMEKIQFEHGGKEYDMKYPEGIPTKLEIFTNKKKAYFSEMVLYPSGHAKNEKCNLKSILNKKFYHLSKIISGHSENYTDEEAINNTVKKISSKLNNLSNKNSDDIQGIYNIPFRIAGVI